MTSNRFEPLIRKFFEHEARRLMPADGASLNPFSHLSVGNKNQSLSGRLTNAVEVLGGGFHHPAWLPIGRRTKYGLLDYGLRLPIKALGTIIPWLIASVIGLAALASLVVAAVGLIPLGIAAGICKIFGNNFLTKLITAPLWIAGGLVVFGGLLGVGAILGGAMAAFAITRGIFYAAERAVTMGIIPLIKYASALPLLLAVAPVHAAVLLFGKKSSMQENIDVTAAPEFTTSTGNTFAKIGVKTTPSYGPQKTSIVQIQEGQKAEFSSSPKYDVGHEAEPAPRPSFG